MRNNTIIKKIQTDYLKLYGKNGNAFQKQSLIWLNTYIRKNFSPNLPLGQFTQEATLSSHPVIGKMYMFYYSPKHKDTLPFYDMFPLTIIIGFDQKKMMGINLHYIHPIYRIQLLSELQELSINPIYQNNPYNKLKLTYERLGSLAHSKWYKPLIKTYLYPHIRSRLIEVPLDLSPFVINLPTERFYKNSMYNVWKDSQQKSY